MPKPFPAEFRRDVVAVAQESRHRGRQPSRRDGEGNRETQGRQKADPAPGARERDLRRAAAFFARELPPK